MPIMYDSAGGHIPATATDILVYSDGLYAQVGVQLRAAFPHATFHTISTQGQVVAEWIDVEPGCVWPNHTAVDLWASWRFKGCRGFYVAESNQAALESLVAAFDMPPGPTPEWFDANWTGVPHIDPGDIATQFLSTPAYDESLTSLAFENTPTPPAPPLPLEDEMTKLVVSTSASPDGSVPANTQWVVSGAGKFQVVEPNNNIWSQWLDMIPQPVSGAFLGAVPTI